MYIGQTNNPERRKDAHFSSLRHNKHYNTYLQNSWNKYGEENFEFTIVGEYDVENISEWEIYWIKMLNTRSPNGYNMSPGGEKLSGEDNPFYGKHHSDETKKVLSEKHKNIYNGENNPMYGKHHSDETKEKIKQKNLEKNMYEYHRKRMMNNRAWEQSRNINPVIAINHDSKQVLLFYTRARAGRYLREIGLSNAKTPESAIRKYLDNEKYKGRIVYGFEWIYAHELISNSFVYQNLSTCGQGVNCLACSSGDKIDILFKPYFLNDKDEVIDLSNYYAPINDRVVSIKLWLNNMMEYFTRGDEDESKT